MSAPVYYWGIRPSLISTQPAAALDPLPATRAPLPDVHDEQGIPYPDVPRIPLDGAKARFDAGSALFVDVRDRDAYAAAHIPNSFSLPLGEIVARAGELPEDAESLPTVLDPMRNPAPVRRCSCRNSAIPMWRRFRAGCKPGRRRVTRWQSASLRRAPMNSTRTLARQAPDDV